MSSRNIKKYQFILDNKVVFTIPRDIKLLNKFPEDISNQLLNQEKYVVSHKVTEKNFISFLEFVIKGDQPKVNSKSIIDYIELCEVFKQRIDYIESENGQNIYKEAVMNCLISNQNNNYNKGLHEEFISKHLDEFLDKHWNGMKQIKITSLYNIFFSNHRKLSDEKVAYRFITENPKEIPLFILLPSLDGNNLGPEICEESIAKKNDRFGFIPQHLLI